MAGNGVTRRQILKGAGAIPVAGGLAAMSISCGDDDSVPASPAAASSTSDADIKLAKSQVLKVRLYDEPTGFDPATLFRIEAENVATPVYSGLTGFDPSTGAPIPDLAKSWDVSADGKTYTFHLVENAEWHQGFGKVTSADVKYSYERVLDPATKSPYAIEFSNIAKVEAPEMFTVVITLKNADVNFLYQVGNYHQGEIVKKEAIEKYGADYKRNPVGTGPFALTRWTPNSQIVLEAHPGYFKGRPTLDRIEMNLIKDITATETALNNGEVDLAINVGGNAEVLNRIKASSKLVLHKSENYANSVTIFNPDYKPLADIRVRQAIAYGYDQKAIAAKFTPDTATVAYSILPPFMPEYSEEVPKYAYDPAKAKALLKEAGYGTGLTVREILSAPPADSALLKQAQLAEVGIKYEFDVMETAIWSQKRASGDYQIVGRLNPAVNPDTLLFGYLHPDQVTPKGINGAKYNNPVVTQKLEQARAEQDKTKRKALYAEIQKIALTDLPYLPTTTSTVIWAGYPYVKNVQVNKLATIDYFPVKIAEHG